MKVFRALATWRVPDLFAKAIPARNSVQRGDFRFRSRKSPSLEPNSGCLENLSTTRSSHADEARRLETSARSIPVKSVPNFKDGSVNPLRSEEHTSELQSPCNL